jgi:hypothetical protein
MFMFPRNTGVDEDTIVHFPSTRETQLHCITLSVEMQTISTTE